MNSNTTIQTDLRYWLLLFPLGVSVFLNIPGYLRFGNVSFLGTLTLVYTALAIIGLMLNFRIPVYLFWRIVPYLLFLFLLLIHAIIIKPGIYGWQNLAMYLMFALLAIFAGSMSYFNSAMVLRHLDRIFIPINYISSLLLLSNVLLYGLGGSKNYIGASLWFIHTRSFAMFACFPLSWYLIKWRYGHNSARWKALLWIIAILLTLSRTATAIALFLVIMAFLPAHLNFKKMAKFGIIILLMMIAAYVLVTRWAPLRLRFVKGDSALQFAGIHFNTSGRVTLWTKTYSEICKKPIFGHGLGTAQELIDIYWPRVGHPHNDYLRIWHDVGIIGLVLYMFFLFFCLIILYRQWQIFDSQRRIDEAMLSLNAFLALLAVAIGIITDNFIVYLCIMAPLALFVGFGLGKKASSA